MNLQIIAYVLIFIGIILKMSGLYYLSVNKKLPFQKRKSVYLRLNWPGNIALFGGIIILALKMYT